MKKITLPLPEKISTNKIYSGMHWTKRKKQADMFHMAMLEFRGAFKAPKPCDMEFIFSFRTRPLDCTNCAYMAKLLEDAMVQCDLLEDDTIKHVQSVTIHSQKGDEDMVEIIIN